jgi:hypothetical protein
MPTILKAIKSVVVHNYKSKQGVSRKAGRPVKC